MTDDGEPSDEAEAWKRRRLKGGDWTDPAASTPSARVDKTVSVKLTEAELAEFDAQIATLGIKRNRALRVAARRIAGFVEVSPEVVAELRDATRQITGIARNVNQIAKAGNRTRDPDYVAFMRQRAALGRELARIEAQMQAVLDLAARREDGLRRLEEAVRS
jgi:type IV secretion system T-DNA border endonuclease VirD1